MFVLDNFDPNEAIMILDSWRNEWNSGVQVPIGTKHELPRPCVRYFFESSSSTTIYFQHVSQGAFLALYFVIIKRLRQ